MSGECDICGDWDHVESYHFPAQEKLVKQLEEHLNDILNGYVLNIVYDFVRDPEPLISFLKERNDYQAEDIAEELVSANNTVKELRQEVKRLQDLAFLLRAHPEDALMIGIEMQFPDTYTFDKFGHIKPKEKEG